MIFVGWSSDASKNDWSPVIWDKYGARCFITQREQPVLRSALNLVPSGCASGIPRCDKVRKSKEKPGSTEWPYRRFTCTSMKQCMVRYKPWRDIVLFYLFPSHSFSSWSACKSLRACQDFSFFFFFSHCCRIPFAKVHITYTHARCGSEIKNTQLACTFSGEESQRVPRLL